MAVYAKTKSKTKRKVKGMSKKQLASLDDNLRADIVNALWVIFERVEEEGLSFEAVAQKSGLSPSTIYRCWGCTFVKSPSFMTIQKLAKIVDFELCFHPTEGVYVSE